VTEPLLLGVDVGGTNSRAALLDSYGTVVGRGKAGGGNAVSCGVAPAVDEVMSATRSALGAVAPARVVSAVIGLAGGTIALGSGDTGAMLRERLRDWGLRATPLFVSDVELAFVSGTGARDGTVLVAGTGATACVIDDRTATSYVDGHGWLLGDRGSGVWIGRRAVQRLLAEIDADAALGALSHRVLRALNVPARLPGFSLRDKVFSAVYGHSPVELAALAPLVLDGDDDQSRRLRDEATGELVSTLALTGDLAGRGPVVLAGGLLGAGGVLTAGLRAEITRRWPGAAVVGGRDGAVAAAWLAAEPVLGHSHQRNYANFLA
jgi:N-acetylglucosamine kinase-like BadF-type ATPase